MADVLSTQYWTARYKNDIINLLLKNSFFIKLMNPTMPATDNLDEIDVLLGGKWEFNGTTYEEPGYIFDYVYADSTTSIAKTFVFVEAFPTTIENNFMTEFDLTIFVCTHKSLVRLYDSDIFSETTCPTVQEVRDAGFYSKDRGNRVDTLCDCIDRIVNGNEFIKGIGSIKGNPRAYVQNFAPNEKFYGKVLRYRISNLVLDGDTCAN